MDTRQNKRISVPSPRNLQAWLVSGPIVAPALLPRESTGESICINDQQVPVATWKPEPNLETPKERRARTAKSTLKSTFSLVIYIAFPLLLLTYLGMKPLWIGSLMMAGLAVVHHFERKKKQTLAKDDLLLEDPDDEFAEIVNVTIIQNGSTTGSDIGLMSVVDNAIVFIGRRTSFTVGTQFIVSQRSSIDSLAGPLGSKRLKLRHPNCDLKIQVTVQRTKFGAKTYESKLLRELDRLADHLTPPAQSAPVYPPLAKDPELEEISYRATATVLLFFASIMIGPLLQTWTLIPITIATGIGIVLASKGQAQVKAEKYRALQSRSEPK